MQFREHVPLAIITVALVVAIVLLYREVSSMKDSLKRYQEKLSNQSLFIADADPIQMTGLPQVTDAPEEPTQSPSAREDTIQEIDATDD
jgi:hypothetical protein